MKKKWEILFGIVLLTNTCFGQDYFKKASTEYFTGDLNKAIELFSKAIENNEELSKSYMYQGAAKSFLQSFDDGLKDLDASKKKLIL
ncbi:MAG: hypothetical protein QM764_21875 [Chitinophagaceae bacterium]